MTLNSVSLASNRTLEVGCCAAAGAIREAHRAAAHTYRKRLRSTILLQGKSGLKAKFTGKESHQQSAFSNCVSPSSSVIRSRKDQAAMGAACTQTDC
jgi:hypothetical protein